MPNLQSDGVLADTHADNGLLTGITDSQVSLGNNSLRTEVETFDTWMASIADMATLGWTNSNVGTSTQVATIIPTNGYLLIDAGEGNDAGVSLQFNAIPTELRVSTPHKIVGPIISTATLMDGREILFKIRMSLKQATIASDWTSKALFGWLVTDTSLMAPTSGAATINTGGGFGFHIAESGVLSTFSQTVDAYTAVDTGLSFGDGGVFDQTSADTFQHWIEFGARATWTDASAATGTIDFYVNKARVATVTNGLPMTSTETYGFALEIANGAAADDVDVAVQSITTAITRAGG